jgi:hypothetical protein
MAGINWRPENGRILQKVAEKRPENIFTIILMKNHTIISNF